MITAPPAPPAAYSAPRAAARRRCRPHLHQGPCRFSGPTCGGRYSRARYYHPGLQRFISEDPLEFGGGDLNLFTYVRNMPTRLRDPLGLFTVESDCDSIATLSGRKDEDTADAVAEGCAPVGPMYASNLDERNRAEEFARRPVLQHVLRQTMLRKLQQARALAKPGHSPTIQAGPTNARKCLQRLAGKSTLRTSYRYDGRWKWIQIHRSRPGHRHSSIH